MSKYTHLSSLLRVTIHDALKSWTFLRVFRILKIQHSNGLLSFKQQIKNFKQWSKASKHDP